MGAEETATRRLNLAQAFNPMGALLGMYVAMEFIQRLIRHIPEKHFKMLRYYGIYAKHHKQEMKLRKCISAEKQCFLHSS